MFDFALISSTKIILIIIFAMMLSTLIILIFILFMRKKQVVELKARDAFLAIWNIFMIQAIEGKLRIWPKIDEKHYLDFLILWNKYQGNLTGDSKIGLNRMAYALDMDKVAMSLLDANSEAERILAVLTLGHLRESNAWEKIKLIAEESVGMSGQIAALSIARINPSKAAQILLPILLQREEWSQAKNAIILTEIGDDNLTQPLLDEIEQADAKALTRLITALPFANTSLADKKLKSLLDQSDDIEIIASCLKIIKFFAGEEWIYIIKEYLTHPSWVVRVQAVNAISQLAGKNELDELIAMLSDENWWVRYRSALAISNLPAMNSRKLEGIIFTLSDRYAVDILTQIATEKKMEIDI